MPRFIGTRCGVNSTEAPSVHLHLRGVAVVEQPVGGDVLVDGAERGGGLGGPAGTRHARHGVDDDAARARPARPAPAGPGRGWPRSGSSRGRRPLVRRRWRRGAARAARRRTGRAGRVGCARRRTTARRSAASGRRKSAPRSTTAPTRPEEVADDGLAGAVRQAEEHAVDGRPGGSSAGSQGWKTSSGYAAARLGYSVGHRAAGLGVTGGEARPPGPGADAQIRSSSAPV